MQIIRERLGGGVANANGVAWVGADGRAGVVSGGGWAETTTSGPCQVCEFTDTDTTRGDDTPLLPIVGTRLDYDANLGLTYFQMGFAAPPGTRICAHLWVLIP